MRALNLRRSAINIQKCLVPDSEFLRKNFGRFALVSVPESRVRILVKIGLTEPKQITDAFFIDDSVIIFENDTRTLSSIHFHDIEFHSFRLMPAPKYATELKLTVVFNDILHCKNQKNNPNGLKQIVKDILKLYVFSQNCAIFLRNVSPQGANGIHCIEILEINGKCGVNNTDIFRLNHGTEIVINKCMSRKKYESGFPPEKHLQLGGLSKYYKILRHTIEYSKNFLTLTPGVKPSNKILLIGPSGCGKTSLVKTVVRDSGSVLLEVLLPEICSSLPGEVEENLQKIFDKARIHAENEENCIILIEDVEILCMRKKNAYSNLRGSMNKLNLLLEEFDNVKGVVVIATTCNVDDVDPQLRRTKRFDDELEIMVPRQDDRREIISNTFEYFNINCSEELLTQFSMWTPGFVGVDILYAVQECISLYSKTKNDLTDTDYPLLEYCMKKVVTNKIPTSMKGSTNINVKKDVDFSKIGGLDNVKKLLDISIKQQLLNPQIFERLGVPLTKGILLYGPPGCAKTTLVKALAKECNTTFLAVSSADLYSPYLGDPEKKILQLFSQARTGAPSIIFIDEIDALVGSKSGDRIRGVQERVLSTLLVEMDGIGTRVLTQRDAAIHSIVDESHPIPSNDHVVGGNSGCGIIVVGATNRPELIDDALKRPGRFDKIIYIHPPNEKERLNILQTLTENMPLSDAVDLELIAKKTDNFSGADLKNLCYESALTALTDSDMTATSVDWSHFQEVLHRSRPSLTPDTIKFYESFQYSGR